jgi:hypothetical protein
VVAIPSRQTFDRLRRRLAAARHATGSARTRRSLANQPDGPFSTVTATRPGEWMQIDSTPFDVAVRLDQDVTGRVELTALVDVRTRSIAAAVLRPTTKAVDASLLLAKSMTPEPRSSSPKCDCICYGMITDRDQPAAQLAAAAGVTGHESCWAMVPYRQGQRGRRHRARDTAATSARRQPGLAVSAALGSGRCGRVVVAAAQPL